MLFGSIDPPVLLPDPQNPNNNFFYGASVAGESFYRALLQFGTFEEYHFFAAPAQISKIRKKLSRWPIDLQRVRVISRNLLPAYLSQEKYALFFTGGPFLSQLANMRNQWANRYFPICGIGHSVSYQPMLEGMIFHNLIADLYPFDSIICTTLAQRRVVQNLNQCVARSFQKDVTLALRYKARLDCLPLGIHGDDFGILEKAAARKRLGFPLQAVLLLYFGRFSLYDKMDLHPLLLALQRLLKEERDVLLILAGNDAQDDYGRTVKKIAREMNLSPNVKVFLNPSISQKNLCYAASDIFVSPSDNIQESFGLTIVEAMASGLPVVAADWNGYKEIVIHGETGFRVPTYWADCSREISVSSGFIQNWLIDHLFLAQSVCVDLEKMSEFIRRLIKNKELRLRLGENGKNWVRRKYDWKVLIPEYEKLWKKLFRSSQRHKIQKGKRRIFVPEYFKCFRHYATRILDDQTEIAINKEGYHFLRNRQLPYMPGLLYEKISVRIIFILLTFLHSKGLSSIRQVESETKKVFPKTSTDNLRYHIMWLAKKNLIQVRGRS